MSESRPADDLLNKAFELAYFILGDRAASIYVAMAAMDKLKIASTNQDRRLYYTPTGRWDYPAARTKVNLSEIHLLQRLVYVESELFERLLEGQARAIQQDDLIIRYIKHLVRITTKHNSFYLTLGLCRLLYNYSTAETAQIYNLALQDPERMRDDYYYRSRKKRLMQGIKDRFGSLVKTQRGLRREERFHAQEDSQEYASLVRECLTRFTPWFSACVLPTQVDPDREVITQLLFEGADPDKEHQVELNRMHTLIHPDCFARLTAALNLDSTAERLELPHFFASNQGARPTEDRFNPAELSEGELDAIRRYLDKNAIHRKEFTGGPVSLVIDGRRLADFELAQSRSVEFDLEGGAELIDIRSVGSIEENEETSLAVSLLTYNRSDINLSNSSAVLSNGRRLSLMVSPAAGALGEGRTKLTVDYEQTSRAGVGVGASRRFRTWLVELSGPRMLRPVLGSIMAALLLIGGWMYYHSRRDAANLPSVAQLREERPEEAPPSQPSAASQEPAAPQKEVRKPQSGESNTAPGADQTGGLRGTNARPAAAMLQAVKRVYIDSLGDDSFSLQLRENLTSALQTSNRFEVVSNRDDADAVFKGSATKLRGRAAYNVVLDLVNARGEVVWTWASRSSNSAQVSANMLRNLLSKASER